MIGCDVSVLAKIFALGPSTAISIHAELSRQIGFMGGGDLAFPVQRIIWFCL